MYTEEKVSLSDKMKNLRNEVFNIDCNKKLLNLPENCSNVEIIRTCVQLTQSTYLKNMAVGITTETVVNHKTDQTNIIDFINNL